jgi:hypothetical protein
MARFGDMENNCFYSRIRCEEETTMAGYEEPRSSPFHSRPTQGRLFWTELCGRVRGLVAQTNREAGETVLCDDLTASGTELAIQLQDGHSFKLQFDSARNRVVCEFPHCSNFNRTLELSAKVGSRTSKEVWTDLQTGATASNEEIAGNVVRNLLIMTNDY